MNIDKIVLNELLELLSENKASLFNEISAERTNHIHVVVENLYQEHNASAVLRTCDCYGINKMHVIENINKYKVNSDIALGAGKWVETESHTQGEHKPLRRFGVPDHASDGKRRISERESGWKNESSLS